MKEYEQDNTTYAFVIDTEQYAGNFERQLCAYITGHVGECGIGEEFADIFEEENQKDTIDLFSNIISETDDNGCFRPCAIYPTLGWFNDGQGNHFKDGDKKKSKYKYPAYLSVIIFFSSRPTNEQIKLMKERAYKFIKLKSEKSWNDFSKVKITGFRLIERKTIIHSYPIDPYIYE